MMKKRKKDAETNKSNQIKEKAPSVGYWIFSTIKSPPYCLCSITVLHNEKASNRKRHMQTSIILEEINFLQYYGLCNAIRSGFKMTTHVAPSNNNNNIGYPGQIRVFVIRIHLLCI